MSKTQSSDFDSLDKSALLDLCDRLLEEEGAAIKTCVAFIEADTRGLWHGRARAMMARRFKHVRLSESQQARVVHAVLERLVNGRISEQFKDQLRYVLHVAPRKAFTAARRCRGSAFEYMRRCADWILSHEPKGGES